MLDFDEEEFICVMTDDGDNKQPGCLRLVMVLAAIVLMVGFLAML